jgi:hypothetical protein
MKDATGINDDPILKHSWNYVLDFATLNRLRLNGNYTYHLL